MKKYRLVLFIAILLLQVVSQASEKPEQILVPQIDGQWWSVAGDPDLGAYTSEKQQPVDFGIWQTSDGTWQIWSCIRNTKCGGNTRLFYCWEGKKITDTDWRPIGIAMQGDLNYGERIGGLQAPHVIKVEQTYYMIYGGWDSICLAKSSDGKSFTRVLNNEGKATLFTGPYINTRDPMVLQLNGLYYCYYMGHKQNAQYDSAIFCRTSHDLRDWSEPMMVSAGGSAGDKSDWYGGDAECPFVVQKDGLFYLFRNQVYGRKSLNTQYCSPNPLNFGVGDDRFMIGELPVAAPEIVHYNGQWYIAALKPSLKGIQIARLKWVTPGQ